MSGAIVAAVVVAGGAAYAANQQAKAQKQAAKMSQQPQWSQTTPWERTSTDMDAILAGIRQQYEQGIPQRPGVGGGKPSAQTQEAMDWLRPQALGGNQTVNSAQNWLQGSMNDPYGGNAITRQLMGNLEGGSPWESMLAGFSSQDPTQGYTSGAGYQRPVEGYTPGLGYDARTGGAAGQGSRPGSAAGMIRSNTGAFSSSNPTGTTGGGSGGLVPENLRHFFENWESVPEETQALLDIMQRESAEDEASAVQDLEARMEGAGRLGSGAWANARGSVAEQLAQEREAGRAGILAGDLNERRQAALAALGLLNDRDLAEMANATSLSASGASAAAARYAADLQNAQAMRGMDIEEMLGTRGLDLQELLGMRAQNLEGITAGLDNSYRNNALMAGLSGDLNSLRLGQLGTLPGVVDAGFAGLDRYLPGLQQQDAARAAAANRNAEIRHQNSLLPRQNLDEYMQRILALNDRYSGSSGSPSNPMPYTGVSPNTAAIMAGLGGFLQAGGANLFQGGGGGGGGTSTAGTANRTWENLYTSGRYNP